MRQTYQNRYRMMLAAHTFLLDNKTIWADNAMMGVEMAELERLLAETTAANARVVNALNSSQRRLCDELCTESIRATIKIANITRIWAERTPGQSVILDQVSFREYKLRSMKRADMLARLEQINATCAAAAGAIAGNPLTEADYLDAATKLEAYKNIHRDARQSEIERQGENRRLSDLLAEATEVLHRIDRLMENYQTSYPVIYEKYRFARNIIDYGGNGLSREEKAMRKGKKNKKTIDPHAAPDATSGM